MPIDVNPTRFQLLAGCTKYPRQSPTLECIEKHTGHRYRIAAANGSHTSRRPRNLFGRWLRSARARQRIAAWADEAKAQSLCLWLR
jgi:hypothetical protein